MHRLRVYVDTSVFGGVEDAEFKEATLRFFKQVRGGKYTVLVSQVTLDELAGAPAGIRRFFTDLPSECKVELPPSDEADTLAQEYVNAGALGKASLEDALHVAAATVAAADLILSLNFKHLVNYDRIQKFNAVNLMNGYKPMDIHSPLEVGYEE
jgi:hypothetical protein